MQRLELVILFVVMGSFSAEMYWFGGPPRAPGVANFESTPAGVRVLAI